MHILFEIILGGGIVAIVAWTWLNQWRQVFEVPEGQAGLMYRHGLYVRRHNAGRRIIWGGGWTMKQVDLRASSLVVPRQELLTADHACMHAGLLVTYQVIEPALALHETQDWRGDLQSAAQLALRTTVGRLTAGAWLNRRSVIGRQLLEQMQPGAAKIGVQLQAVEVWPLPRPSEIRRSLAVTPGARSDKPASVR